MDCDCGYVLNMYVITSFFTSPKDLDWSTRAGSRHELIRAITIMWVPLAVDESGSKVHHGATRRLKQVFSRGMHRSMEI